MMKTFPHMTSYWAMQHMPYQEYLVRHIIMMTAVLWLGSQTLGFEFAGYSDMQNFLLNFAWYVFLAIVIFCCPMIHRWVIDRFFPDSPYESENFIERISDEQLQEQVANYFYEHDKLPPNTLQNSALSILFCIWLFEVFFVLAWVKGVGVERTLIWQPEWVQELAMWVRNNTDVKPFSPNDHGAFLFSSTYTDYSAQELFHKPIADAAMVLHFFRLCFILPIGICLATFMWKFLFFMGSGDLETKQKSGIGSKIWAMVAMFVTLFVAVAALVMYAFSIDESALGAFKVADETSNFWVPSIIWSLLAWGHAFVGLRLLGNMFVSIYHFFKWHLFQED